MEVLLKVNDSDDPNSYKDGDIIRARSLKEIRYRHAQHKCHITNFGFDSFGNRVSDPLLIKFFEKTHKYKLERLNSNDVRKTNLATGHQKIINTIPDEDGEKIHAYRFISSALKSDRHGIFRSPSGQEFWYAKTKKFQDIDVDAIWYDIETHTDFLKLDHNNSDLSETQKRYMLAMNCCYHVCEDGDHDDHDHTACLNCTCHCDLEECSEDFVADKSEPVRRVVDADEHSIEVLHARMFQVPYWDFSSALSLNIDEIRNINKYSDARAVLAERPSAEVLTVDKVAAGIIS